NPGANMQAVFGYPTPGVDVLNWASRYMGWMTLGGTLQIIPDDIIRQVAATRTFGVARPNLEKGSTPANTPANMLTLAKDLCSAVLPQPALPTEVPPLTPDMVTMLQALGGRSSYFDSAFYPPYNDDKGPFIDSNYDKELWLNLCSRFS